MHSNVAPVIIGVNHALFDTTTSHKRSIPTSVKTGTLGIEPNLFCKPMRKIVQGHVDLIHLQSLLEVAGCEVRVPYNLERFRVQLDRVIIPVKRLGAQNLVTVKFKGVASRFSITKHFTERSRTIFVHFMPSVEPMSPALPTRNIKHMIIVHLTRWS